MAGSGEYLSSQAVSESGQGWASNEVSACQRNRLPPQGARSREIKQVGAHIIWRSADTTEVPVLQPAPK